MKACKISWNERRVKVSESEDESAEIPPKTCVKCGVVG